MKDFDFDKKIDAHTKPLKDKLKETNNLLVALVFVLFIGFGACFVAATAMLVDAWNNKAASYQNLSNQIQTQNITLTSQNAALTSIAKKLGVQ